MVSIPPEKTLLRQAPLAVRPWYGARRRRSGTEVAIRLDFATLVALPLPFTWEIQRRVAHPARPRSSPSVFTEIVQGKRLLAAAARSLGKFSHSSLSQSAINYEWLCEVSSAGRPRASIFSRRRTVASMDRATSGMQWKRSHRPRINRASISSGGSPAFPSESTASPVAAQSSSLAAKGYQLPRWLPATPAPGAG